MGGPKTKLREWSIVCLTLLTIVLAWLHWRSQPAPSTAETVDERGGEMVGEQRDSTAFSGDDSDFPIVGVTREFPADSSNISHAPTHFEIVASVDVYERLEPLHQILAATSERDLAWLRANQYPSVRDLETANEGHLADFLRSADVRTQRELIARAANIMAARLFARNDERWRHYAHEIIPTAFGAQLELQAALAEFDKSFHSPESGRALARAMARAQVLGISDVNQFLLGVRGPGLGVTAEEYASFLGEEARQLEALNWYYQRWGLTPVAVAPRPLSPWRGGPCPVGIVSCD